MNQSRAMIVFVTIIGIVSTVLGATSGLLIAIMMGLVSLAVLTGLLIRMFLHWSYRKERKSYHHDSDAELRWLEKFERDRPGKAHRIYKLLSYFSKSSDPAILDVGCHDGHMDEYYSKYTRNLVIGVDISAEALMTGLLNIKKKNLANVEFILADAKALPIRHEKIDWIICTQTIDALDEKEMLVKEFKRILNRDGLVYMSVVSLLFSKLHRRFPRLFVPYLGLFYGRVSPSLKAPYASPMSYGYWKEIAKAGALAITDVSPDVAL